MSFVYEKPKIKETLGDPISDSIETHPCYAQIRANKITGSTYLYGSDFNHQSWIAITIHKSELHRSLSKDWPFEREPYIEVYLSEAQWASFVSSMHLGSGIQCSLTQLQRQDIPQLPKPTKRLEQFKSEAITCAQDSIENLDKLEEKIEELKLSDKKKKELLQEIEFAKRGISSSIEFIGEQFGKHLEDNIEKAKIEVEAYIQNTISRTGLEVLQGKSPLLIDK